MRKSTRMTSNLHHDDDWLDVHTAVVVADLVGTSVVEIRQGSTINLTREDGTVTHTVDRIVNDDNSVDYGIACRIRIPDHLETEVDRAVDGVVISHWSSYPNA